jgi:acyl-CoA-binding protein
MKNVEKYLNSFGRQVVNRAKGNLQKAKGGGTDLEKSIRFEIVQDAKGFTVNFYMNNYAQFVDKGVSGTNKKQSFKDYKGSIKSSPFKYTNKQPPSGIIDKWTVKKGIAPRDAQGKFIQRKSLVFLIARSIKRNGIKSLSFFQKPLGLGLKQYGKDLLNAVKEDILNTLDKETITQVN